MLESGFLHASRQAYAIIVAIVVESTIALIQYRLEKRLKVNTQASSLACWV